MIAQLTRRILSAAYATALAFSATLPSNATTFAAWQVANVPWGDVLNIRKYPSSKSQKQSAYPNGKVLQMTGPCTGGVDLHDLIGAPRDRQAGEVRYRWCQVWHDPSHNGEYVTGWVYGRYIYPH